MTEVLPHRIYNTEDAAPVVRRPSATKYNAHPGAGAARHREPAKAAVRGRRERPGGRQEDEAERDRAARPQLCPPRLEDECEYHRATDRLCFSLTHGCARV